MKNEKKFTIPEAEIIEFCNNEDIITASGDTDVDEIEYPW